MTAEGIAEGLDVTTAKAQSEATNRRAYRCWLREFAAQHPRLETTARSVL
ncbi:MAG: hypothetical protein ACU0BB_07920 [Paracoccaceae bacterium]